MKNFLMIAGLACFSLAVQAADVNADAAQATLKASDCFKCHAVSKKKDGPAYQEVAKKYKGKADAEATLYKHVTTGPKIKLEDGSEEQHKIIKTKDEAEIRNAVKWILSL